MWATGSHDATLWRRSDAFLLTRMSLTSGFLIRFFYLVRRLYLTVALSGSQKHNWTLYRTRCATALLFCINVYNCVPPCIHPHPPPRNSLIFGTRMRRVPAAAVWGSGDETREPQGAKDMGARGYATKQVGGCDTCLLTSPPPPAARYIVASECTVQASVITRTLARCTPGP